MNRNYSEVARYSDDISFPVGEENRIMTCIPVEITEVEPHFVRISYRVLSRLDDVDFSHGQIADSLFRFLPYYRMEEIKTESSFSKYRTTENTMTTFMVLFRRGMFPKERQS